MDSGTEGLLKQWVLY